MRGVPVPAARGGSSPGTCGIIPSMPKVSPWRHWERDAGASLCQDGDGSGPVAPGVAPGLGSEAGFWGNGWIMRNSRQLRDSAVPGVSWMGVLECQQGWGAMEGAGSCAGHGGGCWGGLLGMQGQDTGNAGGDTGDGEGILEVEVRMQG